MSPIPRIASLRRCLVPAALALCCGASPAASQQVQAQGGIPVLAWHRFADRPAPEAGSLTESYAGFGEMLAFMRREGFRSVFPEEVRPGAGRQVVLTFDDGPEESLRAAEMLERHGFRGIFFVIPARTRADGEGYLTPAEAERLARAGHRVAAHGYDHRSMA
ncbi:MAG TPA: polysaccharide deacetylase family protein, partial [Longimicrobiaceae bacterium]|nr:polysaccharide deacetylase family protein [Longimicrobiaceae bacterium]